MRVKIKCFSCMLAAAVACSFGGSTQVTASGASADLALSKPLPVAFAATFEPPIPGGKGKEQKQSRRLALIIDDFGNDMGGTDEILALPVKLTVAVMPFLPTSREDARRAHERGHDVLLHLPMEPKQGRPEWLGPGAIRSGMTDEEIRKRVEAALEQVPYAVGINNHMGSKITGDERVMSVILEVCRDRGLFFVDSKTNYHSVVPHLSREKGLPQLANDIFLDDLHSEKHMSGQLRKVQQWLENRESCIMIGHVGKYGHKSAAVLKKYIPKMQSEGVEFIGISELVRAQISPGVSPGPGFTLP